MAQKDKSPKNYIVVFQDEDGNVLKTAFVPAGGEAAAPEMPDKKGESDHYEIRFAGWDQPCTNVQSNLVLKAVYQEIPKKYLVMYYQEDGKMLGMETVPYKEAAKAPYKPVKKSTKEYDYIFEGWSRPIDAVTEDMNVKAVFRAQRKEFPVRFYHEDGTLLKEENVPYGQEAHPPENVEKTADPRYHYRFTGWSAPFETVHTALDIRAEFESIYNEYTVTFYEEGQRIGEETYHYEDVITYPVLTRKGYDLHWNPYPDVVRESLSLYASYTFSNPKGKIVKQDGHTYQIINPSIRNGGVALLEYADASSRDIHIAQSVKLGDYFYNIEEIHARAFRSCSCMENLTLPDTVTTIGEYGLANCRKLRKLRLGEGLRHLGSKAFAGSDRLCEIIFYGRNLRTVSRKAFEQKRGGISLRVSPSAEASARRIFAQAIKTKKVKIMLDAKV